MPAYLRPMAPTAPAAILCGDPARALAIAQHLLVEPRMSNHHRGLWGYYGRTRPGDELSVQATGIGGPSACAVLSELADLGLRAAIRVGSCHAAEGEAVPGEVLLAEPVICRDGASAALGVDPGTRFSPAAGLRGPLWAALGASAPLISVDHLEPAPQDRLAGAVWDLQSAGLAALAARRGLDLAVTMVVAAVSGRRLEDEPLEAGALRAAEAASAALNGSL